MLFGLKRKKAEKPKSVLGMALFKFDSIYNSKIKNIIDSISAKKRLNANKTNSVLNDVFLSLDEILGDISRDNFKTDYRQDKIRDSVILMAENLKKLLNELKGYDYETEKMTGFQITEAVESIFLIRQDIKKKMKDTESDYF